MKGMRSTKVLALAAALGALAAPTSAVATTHPDVVERAVAQRAALPDVFERTVAASLAGPSSAPSSPMAADDWFRAAGSPPASIDDWFRDKAAAAPTTRASGLDWGDAGIGGGITLGAIALLAGLGGFLRRFRRQPQTA